MRPKKTSAAGESVIVYTDASFDPREKRGVYGWVRPCPDDQQPDHWVGMRKAPSVNQLEVLAAFAAVMAHSDAKDIILNTDSHAVIVAFEKAGRGDAVTGIPSARVSTLHEVLQRVEVDVRKVAAHTTDYWNNVIDRVVRAVMRRLEGDDKQVHLPKQDVVQAALDEARRTSTQTARKAERNAAEQAASAAALEAELHEDAKAARAGAGVGAGAGAFVGASSRSDAGALSGASVAASAGARTGAGASAGAGAGASASAGAGARTSATKAAAVVAEDTTIPVADYVEVPPFLAPTAAGALSPVFGIGARVGHQHVAPKRVSAGQGSSTSAGAGPDGAAASVEPKGSRRAGRGRGRGSRRAQAPQGAGVFQNSAVDYGAGASAGASAGALDSATAPAFGQNQAVSSARGSVSASASAVEKSAAEVFGIDDPFALIEQLQQENEQLRHEHAVLREALEILIRERRA